MLNKIINWFRSDCPDNDGGKLVNVKVHVTPNYTHMDVAECTVCKKEWIAL